MQIKTIPLFLLVGAALVIGGTFAYASYQPNRIDLLSFLPRPPRIAPNPALGIPENASGTSGGIGDMEPEDGVAFDKTGNIVQDRPGFAPGAPYLLYDEPGSPARSVELAFNDASMCVADNSEKVCDAHALTGEGTRVRVEGRERRRVVLVTRLTLVDRDEGNAPDSSERMGTNGIQVANPKPNATVRSPIRVEGVALGSWFFEGSFPIRLLDASGKEIGRVPAKAQGDWTTAGKRVPFAADLGFLRPTSETGTLVFEKDNPSGLPENGAEFRVPVKFDFQTLRVKLYFYNYSNDTDENGNVQCSRNGLVAVQRDIPATETPIQDTIRLLLKGSPTATENARGISTEFPLYGVELKGAALANDGVLTLEFADPRYKTSGGSCRAGILWYQIEATAKQFPEVKEVKFKPDTLFQP